jgi:hypothetical protein
MGYSCRESKNDLSVVYPAAYCTDYAIRDRLCARYYQNFEFVRIFQCRYHKPYLIADWPKCFPMKIKPPLKVTAVRTPISHIRVRD